MMSGCSAGYSPATGVLDNSFDGTGILVDDNAAGVISMMKVNQSI